MANSNYVSVLQTALQQPLRQNLLQFPAWAKLSHTLHFNSFEYQQAAPTEEGAPRKPKYSSNYYRNNENWCRTFCGGRHTILEAYPLLYPNPPRGMSTLGVLKQGSRLLLCTAHRGGIEGACSLIPRAVTSWDNQNLVAFEGVMKAFSTPPRQTWARALMSAM